MMELLRAETRKLLTIRSTYVLSTIAILLLGFICFWALGFKGDLTNSKMYIEAVSIATQATAIFISVIAVLNITHEYRYNTIMYTLTSANSRSKVLLAKLLTVGTFAVGFFIFAALFAAATLWLGLTIRGGELAPQVFYYWDMAWKTIFYGMAWVLLGLLFGTLFRHVVGAIATLLIVPSTVEGLLTIVLKDNTKYLPYTALEQVHTGSLLSPPTAALIFSAYLVGGWIIAWYLFLRRDAN